ncbi:MAG: FAD-linked oxidase C-terminal domain-containing protein [bacterium]
MNPCDVNTLAEKLEAIVGEDAVIRAPEDLLTYECDAYIVHRSTPDLVVMPGSTEEVSRVMALLNEVDVPVIPRGTGTSLAGGCLPVSGGVVVSTMRMTRIRKIDLRNRYAELDAGCINARLHEAINPHGYHYAPDPSSEQSCTIGGTVGTNAGGPHTLQWGMTTNHVLGVEMVLPDGTVIHTGGPNCDNPGYDLTGLLVGSEGTLGIVTGVTVKLVRKADALRTMLVVFDHLEDATNTVTDIIGAGIVPAAMELMDQVIVGAVESGLHIGLPTDAEALLIIELDGPEAGLDDLVDQVVEWCQKNHVRDIKRANSDEERTALWQGRKRSFGCIGKLSRSFVCEDGVVPRTHLSTVIREIGKIGEKYNIRIANIAHAGDGSLHPILLYDERNPDEVRRMIQCSSETIQACLDLGGSVTGEHGIGWEKVKFLAKQFNEKDLESMRKIRDVFNPKGLCNPHKMMHSDVPLVKHFEEAVA